MNEYYERQKEMEAMEEKFGGKWKELCLGVSNLACGDALDKLWQDIILARDPNYGDWEYPGQAYRHLMAEFEDMKAENGRQAERVRKLESALLRIHGLAQIGKEYPTAGNFKRILRHVTNALDEGVRP